MEKEKCFVFKAKVFATIEGCVWAESFEEAHKRINNLEYDEIDLIRVDEIEDITRIGEE